MLCSIGLFIIDVSGLRIGPLFKDQVVFLESLTLEDGTDT
jgi:hypothetical protein